MADFSWQNSTPEPIYMDIEIDPLNSCCTVCHDRADWGAWNIPEYAVCRFCEGCGGLIGVDYE